MGADEFVTIVPGPAVGISRRDEVADLAREKLARSVQMRLRGGVDHGIDPNAARRAQAIRVNAEGGRLVITEHDQAAVLRAGGGGQPEDAEGGIDDLFEPSSGIPTVAGGRLAFRTVRAENLFGQQNQRQLDESVERTVTDTLRAGIVDAYEEAFDEVARRHPEEK